MKNKDLEAVERRSFRAAVDDGLWDILIAGVVAMFSIAPLLSETMGDFWSSAVFVPLWALLYIVIRVVRKRVIVPRVGVVEFGRDRKRRLSRFSWVLLAVNCVAFGLGMLAFFQSPAGGGWSYPIGFSLIVLVLASLAAYMVQIPRFFVYGVLIAAAPLAGEWLFRQGYAAHHGFPVVFGLVTGILLVCGLVRFTSVASRPPMGGSVSQEGNRV